MWGSNSADNRQMPMFTCLQAATTEAASLSLQLRVKQFLDTAADLLLHVCSQEDTSGAVGLDLRPFLLYLLWQLPEHTTLQPVSKPLQLTTPALQTSVTPAANSDEWAQGFTQVLVEDATTVGAFQVLPM
jgi:hypothetical protein